MSLYRGAVHKQAQRAPDRRIAEQRMFCFGARALALDLGPRIGAVELYVLDIAAGHDLDTAPGVAAVFESEEDLVLDLQVPRVVVFAGLDHRASRRHGVATTLHLDRVEIRTVRKIIGGVALALDQITRLEVDEPIGASPDRLQVCRRFAGIRALVRLE